MLMRRCCSCLALIRGLMGAKWEQPLPHRVTRIAPPLLRYLLYMGRSPLFLTRMEPPDAFYDCSNLIIVDGRLTPEAIPTQE